MRRSDANVIPVLSLSATAFSFLVEMVQLEFGTAMDSAISELITAVKRLNGTSSSDPDIHNLLKMVNSRLDIITQCIQLNKMLVNLLNGTAFHNISRSASRGTTATSLSDYPAELPNEPYSSKPGSDDHVFDEGVDSMFNTVIVLLIFIVGITLLIIRSTRGGVCEQCQVPAEEEVVISPKAMFFLNTMQVDERRKRMSTANQPSEVTPMNEHVERRNPETVIEMVLKNGSNDTHNNHVTFAETDL